MSVESNIIFVTNDDAVVNVLKPKLVLLREIDSIIPVNYENALSTIKETRPEVVLIYCSAEQQDCLKLIKIIKGDAEIKNTSVLLVLKEYDQDFVLSAYDEDVTDYFTIGSDSAEILMRTIWGFKKNALVQSVENQHNLLEELGVIDKETGFYSLDYCDKIFENEFKNLNKFKEESVLMLVSPSEESKTALTSSILAQAIKRSTRNSDVVAHSNMNRFYILLTETNLQGAFRVADKIKKSLGDDFTINAGVGFVGKKTFENLKADVLSALLEAASTKQDVAIVSEQEKQSGTDWLDKINSSQKNFKIFKQAFIKKLDKVITPVFFQMQKLYEEKLFKTTIEQYSNSTQSVFVLKKAEHSGELKITYPGFSKINIDVIYSGLDSPENRRISLDLTELEEKKLTKILEDFIKEFKGFTE